MKKFGVDVRLNCYYSIEAETREEAIEKAWDLFMECVPDFMVEEGDSDTEIFSSVDCEDCARNLCRTPENVEACENCQHFDNHILIDEADLINQI